MHCVNNDLILTSLLRVIFNSGKEINESTDIINVLCSTLHSKTYLYVKRKQVICIIKFRQPNH